MYGNNFLKIVAKKPNLLIIMCSYQEKNTQENALYLILSTKYHKQYFHKMV